MIEVQARLWHLDRENGDLARLAVVLDGGERARAEAFRHDRDRQRYVARRGLLRQWLGTLVGQQPEVIRYGFGPQGKLHLPDWPDLHFNLSRSGDTALAVACAAPVGCDLERIRGLPDHSEIVARLFSPNERNTLASASPADQLQTFLAIWTRKEALLKGLGLGLTVPPDRYDVAADFARYQDGAGRLWLTQSVPIGAKHLAAVAIETAEPFTVNLLVARN